MNERKIVNPHRGRVLEKFYKNFFTKFNWPFHEQFNSTSQKCVFLSSFYYYNVFHESNIIMRLSLYKRFCNTLRNKEIHFVVRITEQDNVQLIESFLCSRSYIYKHYFPCSFVAVAFYEATFLKRIYRTALFGCQ